MVRAGKAGKVGKAEEEVRERAVGVVGVLVLARVWDRVGSMYVSTKIEREAEV